MEQSFCSPTNQDLVAHERRINILLALYQSEIDEYCFGFKSKRLGSSLANQNVLCTIINQTLNTNHVTLSSLHDFECGKPHGGLSHGSENKIHEWRHRYSIFPSG